MSRKNKSSSNAVRPAPSARAEKVPPARKPQPSRSAPTVDLASLAPKWPPAWVAVGFLILALLIYSNSFGGSFIYDDDQAINKNDSIRHFWTNPLEAFFPPFNLTVGGRPLLNLSFAINYAISGMNPWSYHVLNFSTHVLAAITLMGVLRRTFLQPILRDRYGKDAQILAIAITLLWIVNPLQTESVSYISQRAEALMAVCYLFTLYCFIRYTDPQTPAQWNPPSLLIGIFQPRYWTTLAWAILAVVICSSGAAFKEIMISAPIMTLLYDRTFVAGSFSKALSRRGWLYAGLALTWVVIAYGLKDYRGGRVIGYDYGITGWDYALTECPALVHYIALMFWPHPLIIDYGTHMYKFLNLDDILDLLPYEITIVGLLIATGVALVRWPLIGFVCAWFFIILAPTSSFFPIVVSPIGEHRLYLPLLTLLVPLTVGLRRFLGDSFWFPVVALALLWAAWSYERNDDYATDVSLWAVTVGQEPDNARAHNNYGVTLLGANRAADAAAQFEMATTIQPSYPDAHYNWGNATAQLGRYAEAITHYQMALMQKPTMGSAQNNWGNALDAMGKTHEPEAINHYLAALQLDPNDSQFHYNLGHGYLVLNRLPDAMEQFQEALRINPNLADTHNTLGIVYYQMGDKAHAIQEFQIALQLNPNLQAARDNLMRLGGVSQ